MSTSNSDNCKIAAFRKAKDYGTIHWQRIKILERYNHAFILMQMLIVAIIGSESATTQLKRNLRRHSVFFKKIFFQTTLPNVESMATPEAFKKIIC